MPNIKVYTDASPSLEDVKKIIGGWVELIKLPDGSQLLVNEEGLIDNLELNLDASVLAKRPIVGDAVHLKDKARWK